MLSKTDTACHKAVLTNDGTFGSCVTSSKLLIAFAALTDIESSSVCNSIINSEIVFLKFFGVD